MVSKILGLGGKKSPDSKLTREQQALQKAVQTVMSDGKESQPTIMAQLGTYLRLIPESQVPEFVNLCRRVVTEYDKELQKIPDE